MAELLDWEEDKEPVQEDNPETKDEALRAIAEETAESEDDNTEDTLPEKYRGKSVQDLVRMHQEAEKAIGRKGSEVGELRKVVDEYIKAQSEVQQAPTQPVAEEPVDWFDDPDKALEYRLANDPRLKSIEQDRIQTKRERNLAMLERKQLSASTVDADKESRKEAAKAASNGGATGSGQPQTKKKFRRADVIKLMNSDPDRYALMADEILLAYKEGRVI